MAAIDDVLSQVAGVKSALSDAGLVDQQSGAIRLEVLLIAPLVAVLEELQAA